MFRECLGGIRGCCGIFTVCFVPETAHFELKSGRVSAPARSAPFCSTLMSAWCWMKRLAAGQGLTLVHFSAQRKRLLWDRGCI